MSSNDRWILVAAIILAAVAGGLAWSLLKEEPSTAYNEQRPESQQQADDTDANEPDFEPIRAERSASEAARTEVASGELREPEVEVQFSRSGPRGSVRGIVYTGQKKPVAGAQVELLVGSAVVADIESLQQTTGIMTSTDESGSFLIEEAPVGKEFLVKASHPDWSASTVGPIEIKDGQVTNISSILLKSASRVWGQVTDASGLPIIAAEVSATNRTIRFGRNMVDPSRRPPWKTITTDPSGQYTFENLAFKDFSITVRADGYATQTKVNTSALTQQTEREINFQLGQPFLISGWVKDDKGLGLQGAEVTAHLLNSSYLSGSTVKTDPNGAFRLANLSEGNYVLNVVMEGYTDITGERTEAGAQDKVIIMRRQGAIEGQVIAAETGDPVRQFIVTVKKHRDGRPPINTNVELRVKDSEGKFQITGLDPDIYKVFVRAKDFAIAETEPVQVQRDSSVSGLTVFCDKGGTITGRVTDANGRGVDGAIVKLNVNNYTHNALMEVFGNMMKDITKPERTTKTDAEGIYELPLLSEGEFQVAVAHPDYTDAEVNDIMVAAGTVTSAPNVVLTMGGSAEGVVYDENGAPIPGARVSATTPTGIMESVMADEGGYFKITHLRPGTYKLTIQDWPESGPEPTHPLVKMALASKSVQEVEVGNGSVVRVDLRLLPSDSPRRDGNR